MLLVAVVRRTPVSLLVRVTEAAVTAPPEASTASPETVPSGVWPCKARTQKKSANSWNRIREHLLCHNALSPILWNCKVETVIRSKFHPLRDVAIAVGAVLLFAWFAQLASRGGHRCSIPPGATRSTPMPHPWLTLVMKAASRGRRMGTVAGGCADCGATGACRQGAGRRSVCDGGGGRQPGGASP